MCYKDDKLYIPVYALFKTDIYSDHLFYSTRAENLSYKYKGSNILSLEKCL